MCSIAIEKRDGKQYTRGKVKLENGSPKDYYRVARGCKLEKEAMKIEDSSLVEYNEDLEQMWASNITFEELTEMYLRKKQGSTKSSMLATGKYMSDQMNGLYDKRVNLIKSKTIKDSIGSYNTPEYKLSYVNRMRTYLNKFFSFAAKQNSIECNPVSSIPNFRRLDELKEETQSYILDEWKRFVQASPKDGIMYYTICCTPYYIEMRRGEVPALNRKDDVDIVRRTIRVNKTVPQYVSGQKYVVVPPETRNSYRIIKMPGEELQIMKKYLEWHDSCPGTSADSSLFGMDQSIIPELLSKRSHGVADAAGLLQIRIHDFRHSHTTLLINHGASIKAIVDRFGNTVGEVLKTYFYLFNETEDATIQITNNVFKR